jgi:hypothetical protein
MIEKLHCTSTEGDNSLFVRRQENRDNRINENRRQSRWGDRAKSKIKGDNPLDGLYRKGYHASQRGRAKLNTKRIADRIGIDSGLTFWRIDLVWM